MPRYMIDAVIYFNAPDDEAAKKLAKEYFARDPDYDLPPGTNAVFALDDLPPERVEDEKS